MPDPKEEEQQSEKTEDNGIVTTPEELESYSIVKVLLRDVISPDRIYYRDNKSYFNIIIDNNIRKWIIGVFFEKNRNFIVLNDAAIDKERTVIDFQNPIDIMNHQEKIISLASPYIEVLN